MAKWFKPLSVREVYDTCVKVYKPPLNPGLPPTSSPTSKGFEATLLQDLFEDDSLDAISITKLRRLSTSKEAIQVCFKTRNVTVLASKISDFLAFQVRCE